MSLKTYELRLECGKTVHLRLTSRALSNFIEKHGIEGAAPVVSVINAVNSLEATIALLSAAMRYPGAVVDKDISTGAELIDLLADEDKGDIFLKGLVVQLARDAGLLDDAGASELANAMGANSALVVTKIAQLLRLDGGGEESQTPEDGENPT